MADRHFAAKARELIFWQGLFNPTKPSQTSDLPVLANGTAGTFLSAMLQGR